MTTKKAKATSKVAKRTKISEWEMVVPVLSTCHLSEATRTFLLRGAANELSLISSMMDDGTLIFVGDELSNLDAIDQDLYPDLYTVLRFAMLNGAEWVRLSSSGCYNPNLPTYKDGEPPIPVQLRTTLTVEDAYGSVSFTIDPTTGEQWVGVVNEDGGDTRITHSGSLERRLLFNMARSLCLKEHGTTMCEPCGNDLATTETADSVPCCATCLNTLRGYR